MINPTQPKHHEPDGLLAQHHLLIAATLDQNLSQGDLAILSTITEGYWPDTRRAFASHLFLAARTGLARVSVIRGLKRLTGQGYIKVLAAGRRGRVGQPGRATEYLPCFNLVPDRSAISITQKGRAFSSKPSNCIVEDTLPDCIVDDTREAPICIVDDTKSPETVSSKIPHPTPSPGPIGPGRGGRNEIANGVATPPPGAPPYGADRGGTPLEGFEELVAAYGVNRDIEAARTVYTRLAPDGAEHRILVATATKWRVRYDDIGRQARFRKSLHNWLLKKYHLEDLPEAPVDPIERRAAAKRKATTKSRGQPVAATPKTPSAATTFEPQRATIVDADVGKDDDGGYYATVEFDVAGETFSRVIPYASVDAQQRAEGKSELAALCLAAGLKGIFSDTDALIAAVVTVTRQADGRLFYAPAAANDDRPQVEQQEGARPGAL